jgi:hypothetical protein
MILYRDGIPRKTYYLRRRTQLNRVHQPKTSNVRCANKDNISRTKAKLTKIILKKYLQYYYFRPIRVSRELTRSGMRDA